MPRSTKSTTVSNKRKAATARKTDTSSTSTNPTQTEDTPNVTTTEESAGLSFDFVVEAAPEDYQPERSNPGRKRAPSPFDDTLVEVKDKGWQRIAYANDEQKDAIVKELHRAKQFRGLGMDLNETSTHVEFQTRDLQKRAPRRKRDAEGNFIDAAGNVTDEANAAEDTTDDGDADNAEY